MLLPSISHEEIDTTSVHTIYWPHPLVLAVFGDIYAGKSPWRERINTSRFCSIFAPCLPADFLNCSRAINNVLTCFSLFVNILHYRLHFLPYCIEEKRLGFLLHILSFYTCILEW